MSRQQRINVPTTKQEIFSILNTFLSDSDIEYNLRSEVWWVLTALRGPDDESITTKETTTAVIRCAALPEGARSMLAFVNLDNESLKDCRKSLQMTEHFSLHVRQAFKALGLTF